MKKGEIIEKLTELEVEFDPNANKVDLEALLEEAEEEEELVDDSPEPPKEEEEVSADIKEQIAKEKPSVKSVPKGCKRIKASQKEASAWNGRSNFVGYDPEAGEIIARI